MIGGIDIQLRTAAGKESLEIAARAMAQLWPDAVFAHGETAEVYDDVWLVPFYELEEIFIYRDSHSAEVWLEKGAVPESLNHMVHLIYDPGLLTVVIDNRGFEMDAALDAIKSGLADDIHSVCATQEPMRCPM